MSIHAIESDTMLTDRGISFLMTFFRIPTLNKLPVSGVCDDGVKFYEKTILFTGFTAEYIRNLGFNPLINSSRPIYGLNVKLTIFDFHTGDQIQDRLEDMDIPDKHKFTRLFGIILTNTINGREINLIDLLETKIEDLREEDIYV